MIEILFSFMIGVLGMWLVFGIFIWMPYRILKFFIWLATPSPRQALDEVYDPDTYYDERI